ncbi:hypothetical protein C8J56DRAFT_893730 [Mycena floridula]|nr:hypothetical protein C8J56DRAFT_893730 [Mycena floridula]
MTPDEVALLIHVGQVNVLNFSAVVAMSFCYGTSSRSISPFSVLNNIFRKRNKTTATWALCSMLTLIFLITTTYFCMTVAFDFRLLIGALIANPELQLSERVEASVNSVEAMNLALNWVSGNGNGLLFIFGDGIVVWRAWAVWPNLHTYSTPNIVYGTIAALDTAIGAMSIVTNGIAVILIGIKAYLCLNLRPASTGNSAAGKVLMFMTDSGIVYIVFQIINLSLSTANIGRIDALYFATHIWTPITTIFSAAYPSLVILIVDNRYSIAQITDKYATRNGDQGTHISFAQSPLEQGTTDSTVSQSGAGFQASAERTLEKISEV